MKLSVKLRFVVHADYPCDLHCYIQSPVLFCRLFRDFTLVLIHNEYQRDAILIGLSAWGAEFI